ncbi:MAG: type II toxin-antitoxin system RelE/ParE family toxin [Candidatus Binatia bacterium]
MAQVVYSRRALDHLQRAVTVLTERDPEAAVAAAKAIRSAVDLLADHPLIGRRIHGNLRELVISYGRTGYVALYRFLAVSGQVRVLAIKHQREFRYPL